MSESILNTIKKLLGLSEEYDAFDTDVILQINSVFNTLHDLGVGPTSGFQIEGAEEEWEEFITDIQLNRVKTYIYLKVRLVFDPPGTSFLLTAIENQIKELEWRMNVRAEDVANAN